MSTHYNGFNFQTSLQKYTKRALQEKARFALEFVEMSRIELESELENPHASTVCSLSFGLKF